MPKPEDVKQTGLGDCYLQAVLISLAYQDPGHLKAMIKEDRDTVTVTFYHLTDTTPRTFIKNDIMVEKSLPVGPGGTPLYNAGELWVRFIQKAFAVFAEKYGKYGDAYSPATGKGYAGIAEGMEFKLYGVFYGDNRRGADRIETSYSAGEAGLVTANRDTIELLLQFKGLDATRAAANEFTAVTAGASLRHHLARTKDLVATIPQRAQMPGDLEAALNGLSSRLDPAIEEEQKAPSDPVASKPNVVQVITQAKDLTKSGGTVDAYRNNATIQPLFQLLLDLANAGSDQSKERRFIYSAHAYSILDVTFADSGGRPMTPRLDRLDEDLTEISATESKLKLRNPHRANAPNPTADEAREQADTGEFTLTLAEFLRNFTEVDYGWVKKG